METCRWKSRVVRFRGLRCASKLTALYRERAKDRILYVKGDSTLPFGVVEAAMVAARAAGVRVVAAVTERTTQTKM